MTKRLLTTIQKKSEKMTHFFSLILDRFFFILRKTQHKWFEFIIVILGRLVIQRTTRVVAGRQTTGTDEVPIEQAMPRF